MAPETREHEIDLSEPPDLVMAAVARAAEAWGAELERQGQEIGGRLHLPFVAGLRRGLVSGPLSVEPIPEGSRVIFRAEESAQYVQSSSVVVLLIAAVGALLTVIWPFYPELLPVAPFGAILALGGWFLVVSRLRSSGPEEFLAAVAAETGGAPPPK
jgi:hypothetical protein